MERITSECETAHETTLKVEPERLRALFKISQYLGPSSATSRSMARLLAAVVFELTKDAIETMP
jgi:hypothetical protein